jgi:pimeloyl-ACP methyl ester carboxylesterase
MTERFVEVPGGRLAVTDTGTGRPIVLLHAGIVDSRAWAPLVGRLQAAGYRTIAFDRRGVGASITDDVPFSNRDDVRAVMDALGVERACLVGASVGGQIAADVAAETPERVAALVLVGATIGGYEPPATPDEEALFARLEELEESGSPDEIADFDVRLWVDGPGQPEDRVDPAIRELVRAMTREIGDPARVRGRPIPLEPRAAERLAALTMPVLAVAGAIDVSDVPATAVHLEKRLPQARALIWRNVAHMVALEAPDRLAEAIVEHLQGLPSWG